MSIDSNIQMSIEENMVYTNNWILFRFQRMEILTLTQMEHENMLSEI